MVDGQFWWLLAFALAALSYSSVGHGGASAYLALGVFAGFPRAELVSMALVLNTVVASIAVWNFREHLRMETLVPLIVTSIPAVFLARRMHLPPPYFSGLLGGILVWSGLHLSWLRRATFRDVLPPSVLSKWVWMPASGVCIGLVSGALGIGGGIFLSPIALILRWTNAKQTAALSAAFIVVNSVSGLLSSAAAGEWPSLRSAPFVAAAVVGGLVGGYLGSKRFSSQWLTFVLGMVLILAGVKLIAKALT